jgi:hypothetical protein
MAKTSATAKSRPAAIAKGRARRDPDALFAARKAPKRIPFDFVIAALEALGPYTRPMFGCTAVYVDERIVFVLRDKKSPRQDDGVWVATTREHHATLRRELPGLRSIRVLAGGSVTGWQVIPADSESFEEAALRACDLVVRGDPRIGKIPASRRRRA